MNEAPVLTNEQEQQISRFLRMSGYGRSDILARNYATGTFLTRNGGKYRVEPSGRVRRISGPPLEAEERD